MRTTWTLLISLRGIILWWGATKYTPKTTHTHTLTCCCVHGEKAFRVSLHQSIRDFLLRIFIVVGCKQLDDFRTSRTVFRYRRVIHRLFCQWHIIILVVDFYVNLQTMKHLLNHFIGARMVKIRSKTNFRMSFEVFLCLSNFLFFLLLSTQNFTTCTSSLIKFWTQWIPLKEK